MRADTPRRQRKDDRGPSMRERTKQAAVKHMDKVIYTFWTGSNAMSSDRQRCFESIVKNSGCDVVLVTQSNLNDFILSDEPLHEGYQYLSETHKADYLRCYFLHHFGGGYADIKQTDFDWSPWFDKFDDPTIWAVGYQEVGPTGVAYGAKDRSRLTAEFEKLIGNGAYIFRRNTELTRRWYEELKQRMDIFLTDLKRYPSRHPRDELNRESSNLLLRTLGVGRSNYPITWSGILADIFHPLVYEFTDRIDKTLPLQKWRTAAEAYTLAQNAFSEGRYDKARRYAAQAELLVSEEVGITRVGMQPASPIASVIIVIHRQNQEVEKALYRLAKLGNKYEIIIVDNGCGIDPKIISECLAAFVILRVDFNYGCCGARNVGARFSNCDFVLFLDDDGFIEEGSIETLIDTALKHKAVAVRGKVLPRTPNGIKGKHYDLGDRIAFAAPTTEGISVWNRNAFVEQGGFDTLMQGHEGFLLYAKLYKFYGPEAFLYVPTAVMRHDFAKNEDHMHQKKNVQELMEKYLLHVAPQAAALRKLGHKTKKNYKTRYLRERIIQNAKAPKRLHKSANEFVSVVTTARNAGNFIHDFCRSFRNQRCQNFEVVFVDDGSEDETGYRIESRWDIEADLKVIKTPPIGRASALNLALSATNSDICLISDVDDINLPGRVEATLDFFLSNPDQACVSFNTFDERRVFFTPQQKTPLSVGIRSRSLFGMPVAFPTFAFRRSIFSLAFDEALQAGIDCDWIHRNLRTTPSADGRVGALNMVYRREHPNQISSRAPDVQRSVAINRACEAQSSLLGNINEDDRQACLVLGGWEDPKPSDLPYVEGYITRILVANLDKPLYDQTELELMLFDRLTQLKYKAVRQKNETYKAHIARARAKPFGYLVSTLKKNVGR